MSDLAERPRSDLVLDLMFAALRVAERRQNALAIELLGRFGEQPVARLALEAARRTNRPAHRLRVLGAIARIGSVSDSASYLLLFSLIQDRNPEIRLAAIALLHALRPRAGAPPSEPIPAD